MRRFLRRAALLVALAGLLLPVGCDKPDPSDPASHARFELVANRTRAPADGATTVDICAYVLNPDGTPVEGEPIFFSTTCGVLSTGTGALASGTACVTLTAPLAACQAVVTARAINIEETVTIQFDPVDSSVITLVANPDSIPADGSSTSTITGTLWTDTGEPVPDGTNVTWHASHGSITSSSSTTGGKATATLTATNFQAVSTVTASSAGASGQTDVTFYSTDVSHITLRANPSEIPANGSSRSVITAEVWSRVGTHVPDGTTVYFTTTAGSLSGTSASTTMGVATIFLTAASTSQHAMVTATSGTATRSVWIYFYYDPDALQILPSSSEMRPGETQNFSVQGGDGNYSWSLSSSSLGSLNTNTGTSVTFTAGTTYMSGSINVQDGSGRSGSASVSVVSNVSLSPSSANLAVGDTQSFSASGGNGSYSWTLSNESVGHVSPTTGSTVTFYADATGDTTLRATDSGGDYGEAAINIGSGMSVSPTEVILGVGDTQGFTVTGGASPYTWSSSNTNVGTVSYSGNSCTFTAVGEGSATLTVYDASSDYTTASITVTGCPAITITPQDQTISLGDTLQLSASGGTSPYAWSTENPLVGTVDTSGLFRTVWLTGTTTVTATDANSCTGDTTVTVLP